MALRPNFVEDPVAASVLFFPCLFALLLVIYRLMCMSILSRNLNVGAVGWKVKMFLAGFPGLEAASWVFFRTGTPAMQDACPVFIPFTYFVRLTTHACLLCYQTTVIIVSRKGFVSLKKRKDIPLCILVVTEIPAIVLAVVSWSLGLGINFSGGCALGRTDHSDILFWDVSEWAFVGEIMELFYCICNVIAELILRRVQLGSSSKKELFGLTRTPTFLICWDLLFQFHIFNRVADLFLNQNSEAVATFNTVYAMFFLAVYLSGFSCFTAFFMSHDAILYFKLSPFKPNFWHMLVGKSKLSLNEIESYDRKRMHESGTNFSRRLSSEMGLLDSAAS